MRRSPLIVLVGLLSILLNCLIHDDAVAVDETPAVSPAIERLQSSYDNAMKKVDADQAKALASLQTQYTNALTALEKKTQDSGAMDQFLVVRKERDRFNAEKKIEEKDISSSILSLKKLQDDYTKALNAMPLSKARSIIKLAQQYDKALSDLEKDLTRKGDTVAALDARSVRDSLETRPEITEARAAVAAAEPSKMNSAKPVEEPAPAKTVKTATPPEKKGKATSKKTTAKPENYLKQRFTKLYQALQNGDDKTARELVDPEYLKKEGEAAVDLQLKFIFGFVQLMKYSGDVKVACKQVKIDDKGQAATLVPKLWYYNKWNDQIPLYWIQVDEEWYLDVYSDIRKGPKTRDFQVSNWSWKMSR